MLKTITKYAKKRAQLPCINTLWVKDGKIRFNDLDIMIEAPYSGEPGIWHAESFDKGVRIKADINVKNMPEALMAGELESLHTVPVSEIAYVSAGMSDEETRYYLNGICFHADSIIATNGHILFKSKIEGAEYGDKLNKILPKLAVRMILDFAKELKEDKIEIGFYGAYKTVIKIGIVTITAKMIDGTFPAYERVIPMNAESRGQWNPAAMDKAVITEIKALQKAGEGISRALVLKETKMTYGWRSWESGANLGSYEVGFNAQYLALMPAGEWRQNDNQAPALFDAGNRLAVCMPMRF